MCCTYEIREAVELFSHFGSFVTPSRYHSVEAVEFIPQKNQYVSCDEGLVCGFKYSEDY
jgi:hypothetical protein